jgi:hypothetical protein
MVPLSLLLFPVVLVALGCLVYLLQRHRDVKDERPTAWIALLPQTTVKATKRVWSWWLLVAGWLFVAVAAAVLAGI